MPIYELECNKCGVVFEVLIRTSKSDLESMPCSRAPKCKGTAERIPSVANAQFKDSGFFVNEYPKGS